MDDGENDDKDTPSPNQQQDLAALRLLRFLVTALLAVMIVGFIVLIGLFVTRLSAPSSPPLALPDEISLPAGATARAFTQGDTWYAVVTSDDQILVYDRSTGTLQQTMTIQSGDQ